MNETLGSIDQRLPDGSAVVSVDAGASTTEVAQLLEEQPGVTYAEPNYIVRRQAWADDSFLTDGTLWGVIKVKAPTAWNVSRGSGITVAVLDSGVALDHPDLVSNFWQNGDEVVDGVDNDGNGFTDDVYGADWVRSDGTPDDEEGHGTHVAGTVAAVADDGNPAVGVAPGAQVMSLKFLDSEGVGNVGDAIAAIDYAISEGASVINASWGGPEYSAALEDAIRRAGDAGVVFATAAGNDGSDNDDMPSYPASMDLPNLISIAAANSENQLAGFSNYGPQTVDVAAPGVDVTSTVGGSYEAWSGTSMATPHVAAVAALLKSTEPGLPASQIVDAIKYGSRQVDTLAGRVQSGGIADAVGALAAIGHPVDSVDAAPSPFRLKRPGKRVRVHRGGKVKFTWSRTQDTDLVGYEIYVDGRLKATVDDPDGSQGPRIARTSVKIKVSSGKHRWSVIAVDEAGNERKAGRGRSKGRVAVISKR
ncbi:MAG: S8 family serine peptidase [Actinobacteria bacterium]|nr:S8 family serine peptidase [Actinomycetota bacterium]